MVIKELQSKRDNVARGVSGKVRRMKDAQELVKTKEIVGWDLKKAHKEAARRVTDFQQLYELVKNQRNKFVNLIQVSAPLCESASRVLRNHLCLFYPYEHQPINPAPCHMDNRLACYSVGSMLGEVYRTSPPGRKMLLQITAPLPPP